jgi:hypothetical protein
VIRGGRLVLRIYAIGLGQVAALAAALAIAREANRRPAPPHADQTRFLVEEIAAHAQDRAALEARLRELKQRTGMDVLLEDRSGNRVAGAPGMSSVASSSSIWCAAAPRRRSIDRSTCTSPTCGRSSATIPAIRACSRRCGASVTCSPLHLPKHPGKAPATSHEQTCGA